jgi:hypothetical protein
MIPVGSCGCGEEVLLSAIAFDPQMCCVALCAKPFVLNTTDKSTNTRCILAYASGVENETSQMPLCRYTDQQVKQQSHMSVRVALQSCGLPLGRAVLHQRMSMRPMKASLRCVREGRRGQGLSCLSRGWVVLTVAQHDLRAIGVNASPSRACSKAAYQCEG